VAYGDRCILFYLYEIFLCDNNFSVTAGGQNESSKEGKVKSIKHSIVFSFIFLLILSTAILSEKQDYIMIARRNFQSDKYRLEKLEEYFKDTELRKITPLMILKFRASRLKAENTKSTCNRYLALLKKMFNFAIEEGYLEENLVKKIKLYSEKDNQKERILTEEEEGRLMKRSSEHLKPILAVALNTGMRLGEILGLKWNQIDFSTKKIRVEKTKSGKVRFIPINDVLFEELVKLRSKDNQSTYLFINPETGKPLTTVKTAFKAACKRAGIKDLRFHDLRHTFGSRLVERGVDIITVKDLLGHSTVKITERYTHSNQEQKIRAVELLSSKLKENTKKDEYLTRHSHMEKEDSSEKSSEKSLISLFSVN